MGVSIPIVAAVNKYVTATTIIQYIQDMTNENPQSKTLFVKSEYYRSNISKTSGRPYEYCWKIKVTYYHDSRFTSKAGSDAIYAKQLLYV